MFYLMKSKYAIFLNIKVTKIERSALLGHPIYIAHFSQAIGLEESAAIKGLVNIGLSYRVKAKV